jgi:hypothetical protein
MDKSPIDELFFTLFGHYPKKAGQAYELLVGAAIKAVTNDKVNYNKHHKGIYSNTDYQVDGELHQSDEKTMLEAKDYTIDNRKVGRGDLQKMQGALTDLDFEKGIFASATDYTKPAKKYSTSTEPNPLQKQIDLYHIRESTELDERGRIKQFIINMIVVLPDFDNGKYDFIWTEEALRKFDTNGLVGNPITLRTDRFYNQDGTFNTTLEDFTFSNQPIGNGQEDDFAEGGWVLTGLCISHEDHMYGLKGINYKIPYSKTTNTFTIDSSGTPKVLIKSEDGKINKLLTDEQLKRLTFDNGEIK